MQPQEPDYQRIFLAVFLAALVLIGWQIFVEWPRRQQLAQMAISEQAKAAAQIAQKSATIAKKMPEAEENARLSREERLKLAPRLFISSPKLHGSLSLKGARFDDLTLSKYKVTLEKDSPDVTLFSPAGDAEAYFADIGWVATDGQTKVPDHTSLWKADEAVLTPQTPATLSWNNGDGVTYLLHVSMDADYMFSITQEIKNQSGRRIEVAPYAYINRSYKEAAQHYAILHEGPLGVIEGALGEINYKDLREKGDKVAGKSSGWFGITDKYWLSAIVPGQKQFKTTYSYYRKNDTDRYQVDYLGDGFTIESGANTRYDMRLFAGAKEIHVLDHYTAGDDAHAPIPLFDRAVDFGVLYFLTKPLFLLLNFFYALTGNFGIAIMLLTIVVKLCMYPLASKSYKSMSKMRALQPEIVKLRERYHDDALAMQKETMALYKRYKINPAAGCMPLIIQMPVFFALYKVLFVTIEMRHAPFFGWLKDLSAADPSNIFTAFGLIPWNTPHFLHLGVLPMLMCASMVMQMRQQPKPADPTQARVMGFMPYFFLFFFSSFPAGLVLYWAWSNTLTVLQQLVISWRHEKHVEIRHAHTTAS